MKQSAESTLFSAKSSSRGDHVSCLQHLVRPRRRLLSIGHSYCVALNRRLAHEMARVGAVEWEVSAVAPTFFHGELRPIPLEPFVGELCHLEPVSVHLSRYIHFMFYGGRLHEIIQHEWDLIHCWEEPYILAGAQVAWWAPPKVPLVYVTAQNISKNYPSPFGSPERYVIQRASGWVAFGYSIEKALLDRPFYSDRRRRVIPLGVDFEHFHPDLEPRKKVRERLGWSDSGPAVVGFLGRFVREKGLEILTAALDSLSCPWRALIAGSGPLEQKLHRWASRYGDRVRVVTGVRHDQVPAYLNAMDILCVPSQTTRRWREQFGRILIEGFACGVPVVASDSGEIPYVVADAGIVVGEKDPTGWAAAVAELLENPARRRELASKGIERAHREFGWTVAARKHLEFFDEILSHAS